jgi:hypothetical protein
MLKTEEIRKIEIGLRQRCLFDLEDQTVASQEQVWASLSAWVQAKGEAEVAAFVQFTAEALGLSEFSVLQHLFWLAQALKIQFTTAGRAISAGEARNRLLHPGRTPVHLRLNPSVASTVFSHVKDLLN